LPRDVQVTMSNGPVKQGSSNNDKMTPFLCVPLRDGWDKQKIQQFPADMTGKTQNVSPPHTQRLDYSAFILYFAAVITLPVQETNRYHQQYLDMLDNGISPVPNISKSEMFLSYVIIVEMGHPERLLAEN